jgi:WD40 repeat protein
MSSGECLQTLTGHTGNIMGVMYSPNGNKVASYSWDSTVRIWDVETGVCNHTLTSHSDYVYNVAYSLQGDQIASASDDTTIRVWDVGTGECQHILIGHNVRVYSVTYSPQGDQIASGGTDGSLRVWDLKVGTCLWAIQGHSMEINRIVYSSQGGFIVSASDDTSVRLWDAASGQCRAVIQNFQGAVNDIAWIEATGINYLVTGCSDGLVGMWKVEVNEDHVSPLWITTKGELNVQDATVQDVQGLSQLNRRLLKQRGAVGEPGHRLRESSKKSNPMVSVVPKLTTPLDKIEEAPALTSSVSVDHLEQWIEQAKHLVASIKSAHGNK